MAMDDFGDVVCKEKQWMIQSPPLSMSKEQIKVLKKIQSHFFRVKKFQYIDGLDLSVLNI